MDNQPLILIFLIAGYLIGILITFYFAPDFVNESLPDDFSMFTFPALIVAALIWPITGFVYLYWRFRNAHIREDIDEQY